MDQHYSAFISYKHAPADNVVAAEIQKRLERYHVPAAIRKKTGKDSIGRIFRDKDELPITSDLSDDIGRALEDADFLIVICSSSTKLSAWVPREIAYFLQHHSKKRVLTVLVDGEPGDVIPDILRTDTVTRTAPDGMSYEEDVIYEPLSCDFRVGIKEARRTEIPRLAAALLGCTYDELVMRERQYKRRRNLAIGIPAACMLAVAISYLIWSREEISKNYLRAEENYRLAQENYQLAEENYQKAEENYQLAQENYRQAQANLDRALANQSEYLSSESGKLLNKGDRVRAILLALEALPGEKDDRPLTAKAQDAMARALHAYCAPGTLDRNHAVSTVAEFGMDGSIMDYKGTNDGRYVIIRDSYGNVGIWDVAELTRVMTLDSEEIHDVLMLSDTRIVTLGESGVAAWDLPSGKEIWRCSDENARWNQSSLCVSGKEDTVWAVEALSIDNADFSTSYGMKAVSLDASTGSLLSETVLAEGSKDIISADRAICSEDGRWAAAAVCFGYRGKDNPMRVFLFDSQTASCTEISLNRDYWRIDTMRFVPDAGNGGGTEQSGAEETVRLAVMAYPSETYGLGGQNSILDLYTEVQPMEIAVSCYDTGGHLLWENSYETPQVPKLPVGKAMLFSEETQSFVSLYANRAAVIRASDGVITDQVETTNPIVSCGVNSSGSLILFMDNGSVGVYDFDEPGVVMQMSYVDFDLLSMTFINRIDEQSIDFLIVPDAKRVWLYRAVYDEEFSSYRAEAIPKDTSFRKVIPLGDAFVVQDYKCHLYFCDLSEQSAGFVVTLPGESYEYEMLGGDEKAGIVWLYKRSDQNPFLAVDASDGTVRSYGSRFRSISNPRLTRDGRITYWNYDYPGAHLIIASLVDGGLEETILADCGKTYSRYDIRPDLKYAVVCDYTSQPLIMDLVSGELTEIDVRFRDSVREAVWQGADRGAAQGDGLLALTDGYEAAILRADGSVVARLSQTGAAVVNMTGYRDELIILYAGGLLTRYSWSDGTMTGRTSLEYYTSESFNDDVTWDFEQDTLYLIRRGMMSAMHIIDLDTWEQEAFAQYGLAYDEARDRIVSYREDDDGKYIGYFRLYSVEDLRRKALEELHGSTLTEEEKNMYGLKDHTLPDT